MQTQPTSEEAKADLQLEIAHLLLIDVVGYSKLLVNEQIELLQELNQIVRSTECFRTAEAKGKLIRIPTGDGMALLFFRSPEEPVRCALEISQALQNYPHIRLRMGVHSGPVNQVTDVNDRSNVAGTGINVAQRVMDCGDAGHILLSKHVADDLAQYGHWRPHLHDLGECEVKHGLRLHIVNLFKDGLGNPQLPEKFKRGRWTQKSRAAVRPVTTSRWPNLVLLVALFLSAIALVASFSIIFRRSSPSTTSLRADATPAAGSRIPDKSIAVLPFVNLSDDKENAFFSDGVQDEILTDLAKVADLKVISRTSVMQYRTGAGRNLREIAKALGVAHILEGTVQRAGERVRVSAQLIDARTDTHLWAERYDRAVADVFAIQSEIAESIVAQLKASLSPSEKAAIQQQPTSDVAAYVLYVRARDLITASILNARGKESLFEAVSLLDQAVARDPSFFNAYFQLARTHDQIYFRGMDHTPTRLALADATVRKVKSLRPEAGETHLVSAEHFYCGSLDYEHARQELDAARRLLPNEPRVSELSGYIDRRQGRWEESIRNLKRALELDPRNFYILQQLSFSYGMTQRFAEMVTVLDRALAIVPKDVGTRMQRAAVDLLWRADTQPLRSTIQQILAEDPNAAGGVAGAWLYLALCERDSTAAQRALAVMTADGCRNEGVGFPRAWCEGVAARTRGDVEAAQAAFENARTEAEKVVREQPNYGQAYCVLGMIDAALGRKEEAIREGRRALELLPVTKDSINGALLEQYLAVIYAWAGEKGLALKQLSVVVRPPSDLSYGQLRLHPYWDPLRGDPRFKKIVASLAPK